MKKVGWRGTGLGCMGTLTCSLLGERAVEEAEMEEAKCRASVQRGVQSQGGWEGDMGRGEEDRRVEAQGGDGRSKAIVLTWNKVT